MNAIHRHTNQKPVSEAGGSKSDASRGSISLRGITKRYGGHVALHDINLDIQPGEFLSILGPSGSGKSTILKLIAGFERPTQGVITLDGEDVTLVPANRRDVNTVFQSYALFPHMTVAENVAYPLKVRSRPRAEIAGRVEDALRLVALEGFAGRLPEELSGGQRQRAALARALIGRPRVLLLDEPLSALDMRLRIQMQEVLTRLHEELKLTFVFVTHDQGEALSMSDRIAVVMDGSIIEVDAPSQLYWRPRHRQVASFLGHSNLVHGVIDAEGSNFAARDSRLKMRLAEKHHPGPCTAAIRAEALIIHPVPGPGMVAAHVKRMIFHGATTEVRVDIGEEVVAFHRGTPSRMLSIGDTIGLEIDLDGVSILRD
ncbi:ABC transporter ATP-binding protein [Mesorhizobium sp. M3A.F.Ca.ET.201.01.1.1]|uniref:ABC transporter ATP-binding protein n=1 Tax=Mesorhizobium sp. M3A.F.Ca.ET.201.01.1.1 TaxID=2563946 RepID=UPI00167B4725|nr:ABC transporter ATP-binding protein [Mesorhizobium sp. M3A.F.Ca.ET.201.01.1.1]